VSATRLEPEQLAAVERRGRTFVSAGAGTGKTSVLIERLVGRVLDGTPLDALLVITFTNRAAGELKRRLRARLELVGELGHARAVDAAWISTIHRFCIRVLRQHAFAAGLDPRFAVADEVQARMLVSEAFDLALERFLAEGGDERLDLLAAYGRPRLRTMVGSAYERLRSAGRGLELRPRRLADLAGATTRARSAAAALADGCEEAAALVALIDAGGDPHRLCDLGRHRIRNTQPHREYNAARGELEQAARDLAAAAQLELLQALLDAFAAAYGGLKDARSLLDFTDLELRTRDLLRDRADIAERLRDRFAAVMVDEFQDTNRLQCELIDLVAADDVFLVGDEFQSIYRFRHADVEVFRERRRAATDPIALDRNHRSAPHLLSMVNELFGREFGVEFQPLRPARDPDPAPVAGERVELIAVDKDADLAGRHWRDVEAAAVASRIAELVASGRCHAGDVVLLFEAGTDAVRFEQALRARGLRTVRTTGRGYYQQQQVSDLLAYLRLLHNRYDDVALLTVLASPLVGVSNDGLLHARRAAVRRPIFTALERDEPPPGLSATDRRLVAAFAQRFARLVRRSAELSLERLCDAIVVEHDYDLACLAQPDGDRRIANVRKLARLASEFERIQGPDLEGFVRFCEEQASLQVAEGEAIIAEEADAVVLMTVHAAKGLEFDVVVVADGGRQRLAGRQPDLMVGRDGRVGLRAPVPPDGVIAPALGYADLVEEERVADAREHRRLQYVAMTRARRHLILSGGVRAGEQTPIAAVCDLLSIVPGDAGDLERGGASLRVTWAAAEDAPPVAVAADGGGDVEPDGQLALFVEGEALTPRLEPLTEAAAPPPVALRRLSYSAISLYRRCGYRYFAQRVLGLPEPPPVPAAEGGMSAVEIGDAVHLELERADGRWRDLYPQASDADAERIAGFVAGWEGGPLSGRVGSLPAVQREVAFAFDVSGVLLRGRFDLFARLDDGSALIVDYKTNRLSETPLDEVVDRDYGVQVATYALAALRLGCPAVEVVYAFLERPDAVVSRRFVAADVPALEAGLSEPIDAIRAARFPARPGPHCAECPALRVLCAGPGLLEDG
jgi:ATP-dependent exoDNAse (exonuclease V) beta subunit